MSTKLRAFSIFTIIIVCIQFIQPKIENSSDDTHAIWTKYNLSENLKSKLNSACFDCHSSQTRSPWYMTIQPLGFWLRNHVLDGRKHINYQEFTNLPIAKQYHKLEETIEMVESKEMPMASYTYFGLHSDANLSEEDRKEIIVWAQSIRDSIKASYPADSLIFKKRKH